MVADRGHHLLPGLRGGPQERPRGPGRHPRRRGARQEPRQGLLRWGLQQGRSVIPKSTKRTRIAENIDVFDFELTAAELTALDALETGRRGGPEPEDVTLADFGRAIPEA